MKPVATTLNLAVDNGASWRRVCLAALFAFGAALAYAAEDAGTPLVPAGQSREMSKQGASSMKLQLTMDGQVLSATLGDNPAARDFLALLPLTLDLEDYASTEKIAQLPKKLSTTGTPAGMTPSLGDITYYAPWGNVAIFYRNSGYAKGLVKLGRIEGNVQMLEARGPLKARIEVAAKQ